MTDAAADHRSLRPKRSAVLSLWLSLAAVIGAGVWITVDAFRVTPVDYQHLGLGVIVIASGLFYAVFGSAGVFIAYADRLEFHRFGRRVWSIPIADIGVQEGDGAYSMDIVDMRTRKVKSTLNTRSFPKADLEAFSAFIDDARAAAGVDLSDEAAEEPPASLRDITVANARLFAVVFALLAAGAAITFVRQHLPPDVIIRRSALCIGLFVAVFVAVVLVQFVFSRICAPERSRAA